MERDGGTSNILIRHGYEKALGSESVGLELVVCAVDAGAACQEEE